MYKTLDITLLGSLVMLKW